MDDNLEWLTQNTEDPKSNKGNITPPPPPHTHTVNVIHYGGPTMLCFNVFSRYLYKHG